MLRVRDLEAWYGESHILHGVGIDVREGEVVTLLGRNGAGKTTTIKSIMGMVGKRTGLCQCGHVGRFVFYHRFVVLCACQA